MAYFQYERGAIDESRLRAVLMPLSLGDDRVQVFWRENRQNFTPAYRVYLNELIEKEYSDP